jgi:hypothetical protein
MGELLNPNQLSASQVYEAGRSIRTSAGTLLGISGYSSKGSGQFIQVWDSPGAPVAERFTVNFGALTGADVKGKYFICYDTAGSVYVWGNDSIAPDPAPAGIARGIAFTVAADATAAAALATACAAALDADSEFASTAATTIATVTNTFAGARTNAADGNMAVTIATTIAGVGSLIAVAPAATVATFQFPVPYHGIPCANGIYVTNSSTGPKLTAGSADCYFTAIFR